MNFTEEAEKLYFDLKIMEEVHVSDRKFYSKQDVLTLAAALQSVYERGEQSGRSERAPASIHVTDAARDVLAERLRQVEKEGWTTKHDDEHYTGEIAYAAICYLTNAAVTAKMFGLGILTYAECVERGASIPKPEVWPWETEWWKPSGQRRDLVKAAALIIAEIDRIDRAAIRLETSHD